jgi:hypothetical protein
MAWAITSAAGDLDIDIFFQENAQIGQKMYPLCFCFATKQKNYSSLFVLVNWVNKFSMVLLDWDVKLDYNHIKFKVCKVFISHRDIFFKITFFFIGLDFASIFPVIQWLITKVIEGKSFYFYK